MHVRKLVVAESELSVACVFSLRHSRNVRRNGWLFSARKRLVSNVLRDVLWHFIVTDAFRVVTSLHAPFCFMCCFPEIQQDTVHWIIVNFFDNPLAF